MCFGENIFTESKRTATKISRNRLAWLFDQETYLSVNFKRWRE